MQTASTAYYYYADCTNSILILCRLHQQPTSSVITATIVRTVLVCELTHIYENHKPVLNGDDKHSKHRSNLTADQKMCKTCAVDG